MTLEEFEILTSDEVLQAIEQRIECNPIDIALDKHLEHASAVATQVKRLQRARAKLPSYYAVRATLPPRAYEQSSSEQCAMHKQLTGVSVLDLTCGLGVDTLALSRKFSRVVSLERDPVLAAVTRHNLKLLGAVNVEVLCTSAEEYLATTTEHFDWIFADPDRRSERGEKMVLLEDCSPNMVALYPRLKEVADNICIKCSPLFDTAEAFRKFSNCSVETVSLGGECKEVNIYIEGREPQLTATAIGVGSFTVEQKSLESYNFASLPTSFDSYRYITLPDVALVHSRLTAAAFTGKADVWSNSGVALSIEPQQDVVGRTFGIDAIYEIGNKELKKILKGQRIEIFRRDFPLSNSEICRKFSVKEGADSRWCFTRIGGKLLAIKMR
ncbi:MAG: RsmD family RNA methyltransferase [Alistipes sp.]|nr:RsmD family RNA methyltransferase [Alistipes sp.]